MKVKRTFAKKMLAGLAGLATLLSVGALAAPASAATADNLPDVMLGAFWRPDSSAGNTGLRADSLYMSTDGHRFQLLDEPFVNDNHGHVIGFPSYVVALHDPGLFYVNGNFWMISGWESTRSKHFVPMMSSSHDLVHWSCPNSGSPTNLQPIPVPAGSFNHGNFDVAGPDAMGDSDGSAWIVTSLDYWGANHHRPEHDTMHPYIVHVTGLTPGANREAQPHVSYGPLREIRLPQRSSNWIDPSLWKEGNTYYLSIKKNGIQNQIYSTRNPYGNSWKLVCNNVVTGFEGPSLAKFHGKYMMYTDKLADYPFGHSNGKTGVFVTTSNRLNGGWSRNTLITAVDSRGRHLLTRHGSVLVVTNPALKRIVWNLARSKSYDYFPDIHGQWYTQPINFVCQHGIMTGNSATGRFDPNQGLSREQAATLLWKRAGQPQVNGQPNFKDANKIADYAVEAVAWAQQTHAMSGYGNTGLFGPKDILTREQAAKIIQIASGHENETASDAKFNSLRNHEKTSAPLRSFMVWATANGVITGYGPDLAPQRQLTRAMMAKIMMNCVNRHIFRS